MTLNSSTTSTCSQDAFVMTIPDGNVTCSPSISISATRSRVFPRAKRFALINNPMLGQYTP